MATPTVIVQHGAQSPTTESVHDAAGTTVSYRIELTFFGTLANVLTDWNTLIATNFACPTVAARWWRN